MNKIQFICPKCECIGIIGVEDIVNHAVICGACGKSFHLLESQWNVMPQFDMFSKNNKNRNNWSDLD